MTSCLKIRKDQQMWLQRKLFLEQTDRSINDFNNSCPKVVVWNKSMLSHSFEILRSGFEHQILFFSFKLERRSFWHSYRYLLCTIFMYTTNYFIDVYTTKFYTISRYHQQIFQTKCSLHSVVQNLLNLFLKTTRICKYHTQDFSSRTEKPLKQKLGLQSSMTYS